MRLIGALLVASGCSFQGSVTPDAVPEPDGGGMPRGLGMFLTWNANPSLPGPVTNKVSATAVTFQLEHLQLVSDAGADGRTTRSRYQLAWSAGALPLQEMFPDAPVAVYQRISLDMRGDVQPPYAYQIQGTWRDDKGDDQQFRIADTVNLEVPIDCSETLPPGGSVSITVRVDLRDALSNVNFKNLSQDKDGVLVLTGGPPLSDFRNRLMRAFSIDD